MHSFAAYEFTDAAAQNSKTISKSAVWSLSTTLELQVPSVTSRVDNLS
jgi:hypothetical protein